MVKVPEYRQQRTITGSSGQTMAPLGLADNGMAQAGAAITQISDQFAQAQARIQEREDVITRTREFGEFNNVVSQEWQRIQDEEDLTSPETLKTFNQFLRNQSFQLQNNHKGSKESQATLAARSEDLLSRYQAAATTTMRERQIDMVTKQYEDEFNPILTAVQNGTMDLNDAFIAVDNIDSDKGPALPNALAFDISESANQALTIAAVERYTDIGQWQKAEDLINQNPQFAEVLTTDQYSKVVRRISELKNAETMAMAQQNAKMNSIAQSLGYESIQSVPFALRFQLLTGSQAPGAKPYEAQTDAGKMMQDRQNLITRYGENSEQVQKFDALTKASGLSDPASPIGKMIADKDALINSGISPDDPRVKSLDAEIRKSDPEYMKKIELEKTFPQAQVALDDFKSQNDLVASKVDEAIKVLAGESDINAAVQSLLEGDFNNAIYLPGAEIFRGSDINQLNALLDPIRSNTMMVAMAKLRENSPTGATGLGALSDGERRMLEATQGSLDAAAPEALAQTLLNMRDQLPKLMDRQTKMFNATYGDMTGHPTDGQQVEPEQDVYDLSGFAISGGSNAGQ